MNHRRILIAGLTGTNLAEKLGLDLARTSLNGIEWNALTYAGNTVWNVHSEKTEDGYKGGTKRRPRSEWIMQQDTHPALITNAEAETILMQLESGRIKNYRTRAKHLLTGLLFTPEGATWHGDGEYYRIGKKSVKSNRIDGAVMAKIVTDLNSDLFVQELVKSAHKSGIRTNDGAELEKIQKDIQSIEGKIDHLTSLLTQTTATAAILRKIESLESERIDLHNQLEAVQVSSRQARALCEIDEDDVRAILKGIAEEIDEQDRDDLKEILRSLIERVTFDHSQMDCCIYYKIPTKSRDLVASPTRFELVLPP